MCVIYCLFKCLLLGETSAMDATTTICHRYTPPDQLAVFTKNADIIVSAAGIFFLLIHRNGLLCKSQIVKLINECNYFRRS